MLLDSEISSGVRPKFDIIAILDPTDFSFSSPVIAGPRKDGGRSARRCGDEAVVDVKETIKDGIEGAGKLSFVCFAQQHLILSNLSLDCDAARSSSFVQELVINFTSALRMTTNNFPRSRLPLCQLIRLLVQTIHHSTNMLQSIQRQLIALVLHRLIIHDQTSFALTQNTMKTTIKNEL